MRMIWKYELKVTDDQEILMPAQAKILSVGDQDGRLCVWALVDKEQPIAPKYFSIVGTGQTMSEDCPLKRFLGTVIMSRFVWHVFEVL